MNVQVPSVAEAKGNQVAKVAHWNAPSFLMSHVTTPGEEAEFVNVAQAFKVGIGKKVSIGTLGSWIPGVNRELAEVNDGDNLSGWWAAV